MRVLMVNHFPLEGSGSGTYTKNLAMELVKLGHEVCVICPEIYPDFPQYEGVKIHPVYFTDAIGEKYTKESLSFCFPCFTTHPESNVTFGDLSDEQMCQYLASFSVAIDDELRLFKPDVIHGQHVWALSSLAGGRGVPLVVTCHGTDLMGYKKWPYMKTFVEHTLSHAAAIICISDDNERLLWDTCLCDVPRVVRMDNGYNSDVFRVMNCDKHEVLSDYSIYADDVDIVLFAGKLTHFKGVDVLLDAVNIYNHQLDDVVTIIAGDGDDSEQLFDKASDLGLDNLFFVGNISQDELAKLYNVADVSVVPSRREPFGLVAREAMACGTPVVATNRGGLPEFVNASVGCLVKPEDADDLSRGIQRTLYRVHSDNLWGEQIAAYAYNSYSQSVMMDRLMSVYEFAMSCSL